MGVFTNKIDFEVVIMVNHGNPNGDPLNGNRPREDLDGFGEISDVCLKRKIRNRLQDMGEKIFVQSEERCDDGCKSLADRTKTNYKMQKALKTKALIKKAFDKAFEKYDVIVINFANPDMVGHTGVLSAAITAMEKVDDCAGRIVRKVLSLGGSVCITADHGNLEKMAESDGSPNTAHTTNPVPFILVSEEQHKLHNGILADIAPTLLQLLNIKQPAAMTGKTLID